MPFAQECLVMFSGGRDSWLTSCLLVEQGYKVHLVSFDNSKVIGSENVAHSAARLKEAYGEMLEFMGTVSIAGIWREFFLPYMSMTPSEVIREWGELPASHFNCLTCRSAMYVWAIMKCLSSDIHNIAEGARIAQNWPIMQPGMIERFRQFLAEYSIELLLPVYDLKSEWTRKNLLLMRNFVPKTLELQCLIGVPLPFKGTPPDNIQQAVEVFFDKCILPRARTIIQEQQAIVQGPQSGRDKML